MNEITKLKTELSELQALYQLDSIKAETKEKKLKRHILHLEQDAKEANQLAEDMETKCKDVIKKSALNTRKAEEESKAWEEKYWSLKKESDSHENEVAATELILEKKRNEQIQQKLNITETELKRVREKLLLLHSADGNNPKQLCSDDIDADDRVDELTTPQKGVNILSPAPPAVLLELNRTRVKLADIEVLNRQLKRKIENLQPKADEMVKFREQAFSATAKVEQLERELKIVRREREALRIVDSRWKEFRKDLLSHNLGSEIVTGVSPSKSSGEENIPPEISTVLRQFHSMKERIASLERDQEDRKILLQSNKRQTQSLEKKIADLTKSASQFKDEHSKLVEKLRSVESELMIIQAKEMIWKRESESMRSLLDTYKQMEENLVKIDPSKRSSDAGNQLSAKSMQLSLNATKDEIVILKNQIEALKQNDNDLKNENEALKSDNEDVRQKFMKLREALFSERDKLEKAEAKAAKAETFAGKGCFNQESIQVLHLRENPASNAVRTKYLNEIVSLKNALQAKEEEVFEMKSGTGTPKTTSNVPSTVASLDAQKLNKRLKESFKEQIGLFREGVYLITGFKIDMMADTDRPRFKVRSMYAEQETDYLEFVWPKVEDRSQVTSLDLLDTEQARALSQEPSFQFMQKYKSLPAFMASVCLALFEKQTFVG